MPARPVLVLALASLAGSASAGVITHEYVIPWASGAHSANIDVAPFVAPSGAGPLLSVTVAFEGYSLTQLTSGTTFGGTVPLQMNQRYDGLLEFGDGTDIAGVDSVSTTQNFNISSASPWFGARSLFGATFVAPVTYMPGDAAFDRFTGLDAISMHLELDGGTNLISPPTPGFIGAITGTEWVVRVSYDFVPAPGGLALAGIGALAIGRRRR